MPTKKPAERAKKREGEMKNKNVDVILRRRFSRAGDGFKVTSHAFSYDSGVAHVSLSQYKKAHKALGAISGERLDAKKTADVLEVFVWDLRKRGDGNPMMTL